MCDMIASLNRSVKTRAIGKMSWTSCQDECLEVVEVFMKSNEDSIEIKPGNKMA